MHKQQLVVPRVEFSKLQSRVLTTHVLRHVVCDAMNEDLGINETHYFEGHANSPFEVQSNRKFENVK